jgi:uncharacterized protein
VNAIQKVFSKTHVFLPVIHVENEMQACYNARIAAEEGADGIFLINHSISHRRLVLCYDSVHQALPGFWIGLNCLDLGRRAVGVIPREVVGLWVDNAGIGEEWMPGYSPEDFTRSRERVGWEGLYFGGVAFKHQRVLMDAAEEAALAVPHVDVITTSGVSTGSAPDVGKIKEMKAAIGDHALAIASGITPENVGGYLPYANAFLVATGVSRSFTELSRERVRLLTEAIKNG